MNASLHRSGNAPKAAFWFAILIAPLLVLASCGRGGDEVAEAEVPPGPALWRIADEDSTIWLFGTFHLLPEETEWQREGVTKAFAEADTLILEANVDAVDEDKLAHLLSTLGRAPADVSLRSRLSPEQLAALEELSSSLGVSVDLLNTLQPWYAATFLTIEFARQQGFSAEEGVERILTTDALEAGKSLVFLETVDQQLRFFAELPEPAQVQLLTSTVNELQEAGTTLDSMKDAWVAGDETALTTLINGSLAEIPEVYDAVLVRRNKAWADEIEGLLSGKGSAFVAVGVGHLVGEGSLVALLKERGIEANRE